MEIRVLKYFLAVAQEGSLTAAARRLGITQPTLSRQLKELEDELGRQLYTRGSHHVSLTADGLLLRKRAEEILDIVGKTRTELKSAHEIAGAFYLFFINTVFIATATFLGVKLLRFRPMERLVSEAAIRGRKVMMWVVVVTMIPAAFITVNLVTQDVVMRNVNQFVKAEFNFGGTQVLSSRLEHDTIYVVAVGKEIAADNIAVARDRLKFYGLADKELSVIQADNAESYALASNLNRAEQTNAVLSGQIADLQRQLSAYTAYDTLSVHVNAEAHTLFPWVDEVLVGRLGGKPVAFVARDEGVAMTADERGKVVEWLRTRVDDSRTEVFFK